MNSDNPKIQILLTLDSPPNERKWPDYLTKYGFTDEDVPMSIQIAAKPFDEAMMFRIANAYEKATEWHTRHPDLEKSVGPALPAGMKMAGE